MLRTFAILIFIVFANALRAADFPDVDLTLENVPDPGANSADEPLASSFSMKSATRFLDTVALHWTKNRQCFACHTNFAYLMVRPEVNADNTAHRELRAALEDMVEKRWETDGPRWDAEVVMSAATLVMNDAATTGKLQPTTHKALARMWKVQRADGGFDWLKCGWPPMESDDDYGIAIAALALGAAPQSYRETPEAQAGLKQLQSYLRKNAPPMLHHEAMLMWAESYGLELLTAEQRKHCSEQLLALQKPDGGWASSTLGDWKRSDDKPQDFTTSDGYATGFTVLVLRKSGLASDDPRIQRGIKWLKANQRESGRWFTRSLNKDNKHFLSHAGTAFAVLALTACDEK